VEGDYQVDVVADGEVLCQATWVSSGAQVDGHCPDCSYGLSVERVMETDTCGFTGLEEWEVVLSFPYAYGDVDHMMYWSDYGGGAWYPVTTIDSMGEGALAHTGRTDDYAYGDGTYYYFGYQGEYTYSGFVNPGAYPVGD